MLWKILTAVGAALAIWGMVRKLTGADRAPPPPARRGPQVEDLAQCRVCGAWNPKGEPCLCSVPPTP